MERAKVALQTCLEARIVVTGSLHAEVIIRFPIAEALVSVAIQGPLEIVLSLKGGETCITVVDSRGNTSLALPSLPGTDGRVDVARRILGRS